MEPPSKKTRSEAFYQRRARANKRRRQKKSAEKYPSAQDEPVFSPAQQAVPTFPPAAQAVPFFGSAAQEVPVFYPAAQVGPFFGTAAQAATTSHPIMQNTQAVTYPGVRTNPLSPSVEDTIPRKGPTVKSVVVVVKNTTQSEDHDVASPEDQEVTSPEDQEVASPEDQEFESLENLEISIHQDQDIASPNDQEMVSSLWSRLRPCINITKIMGKKRPGAYDLAGWLDFSQIYIVLE